MTTTEAPTIIKGIDVDRLYVDSIDSTPVSADWDFSHHVEYGEGEGTWNFWEHVEPDTGDTASCRECCETIVYDVLDGVEDDEPEWHHEDAADDEYDHVAAPDYDYEAERCQGPMMNYFYPLEIRDPDAAAEKLAGTCLCVVEVNDETGIALTGGGMDLSWEICEAFMLLGSLPPAHFVRRLPRMADRMTDKHRLVLAGAQRTLAIQKEWAEEGLVEIERVRAYFENEEWRR